VAPEIRNEAAHVVIAASDEALANALELIVQAARRNVILHNTSLGLEAMPLDGADVLIIDQRVLGSDPSALRDLLASRFWLGRLVLLTEDGAAGREALDAWARATVLEMPFVGDDLIRALEGR
jgi:hypothetical protein